MSLLLKGGEKMRKTLLTSISQEIPYRLHKLISNAPIYDSSSSPQARVYFIDKDEGYYLKKGSVGSLKKEADMNQYFYTKGIGAEVLKYDSDQNDWLLTRAIKGEDGIHQAYLDDPKRLCDTMALSLRYLHEMEYEGCPIKERTDDYLKHAENRYHLGKFDPSFLSDSHMFASAKEAYAVLEQGKSALNGKVLLHGDYCLPNIILNEWNLSGFIDLGAGGVGDPHIDLFWGIHTLWFNLHSHDYAQRFLDAYGRDKVNPDLFRIIAAAEVFG